MIVELAMLGLTALGFATSWRIAFHQGELVKAAAQVIDGHYPKAQVILRRAVLVPPLGAEVNQWALLRNLLAYLEIREGRYEEAQRLVDSILTRKGAFLPAIRSLSFDRIAELKAAEDPLKSPGRIVNRRRSFWMLWTEPPSPRMADRSGLLLGSNRSLRAGCGLLRGGP